MLKLSLVALFVMSMVTLTVAASVLPVESTAIAQLAKLR